MIKLLGIGFFGCGIRVRCRGMLVRVCGEILFVDIKCFGKWVFFWVFVLIFLFLILVMVVIG